jgi:hypothetical protein
LVLRDPALRGSFRGKPGGDLRQGAEPDYFHSEAIILAVDDAI